MRYSVYVSGRMPLAYYSPEMAGFYNCSFVYFKSFCTIALPEITGFYNPIKQPVYAQMTIALPEMTGFYNNL